MKIKPLILATTTILIFITLYILAVTTKTGQIIDQAILYTQADYQNIAINLADSILAKTEALVICTILVTIAIGIGKRKYLETVIITATIIFANITTQILKHYVLDRPNHEVLYLLKNSYPSGHVTLAASAMIGLMLIVPIAYKNLFKNMAVITISTFGISVCIAQWHTLSDVIGAILLTTSVFSLAIIIRNILCKPAEEILDTTTKNSIGKNKEKTRIEMIILTTGIIALLGVSFKYLKPLSQASANPTDFFEITGSATLTILGMIAKLFIIPAVVVIACKSIVKTSI